MYTDYQDIKSYKKPNICGNLCPNLTRSILYLDPCCNRVKRNHRRGGGLTGLKGPASTQHMNVDNNAHFRYLDNDWFLCSAA